MPPFCERDDKDPRSVRVQNDPIRPCLLDGNNKEIKKLKKRTIVYLTHRV